MEMEFKEKRSTKNRDANSFEEHPSSWSTQEAEQKTYAEQVSEHRNGQNAWNSGFSLAIPFKRFVLLMPADILRQHAAWVRWV